MDTFLGVLGLLGFIVAIVALAAGVTYAVVRLTPQREDKPTGESQA
jgi:cell division protein FtsX